MKKIGNLLASAALVASAAMAAAPQAGAQAPERTPAFPGAEGFGRYTSGGRGGYVYHVTKLTDDKNTKGTLRWALAQPGPRVIVFDVSGTIHLTSSLGIPANTTIAGQTAPGDGICLADYPVTLGTNNVVRYIRFRLGNKNVTVNGADGWDGLTGMDQTDIIVDHCSVSWSIDECLSVLGNERTTVQWCLVAQSLVNSGHSKGAHGYGGNWGGAGASFHHNLLAHHGSRTPRLGPRPTTQLDERMDMRNNVIYNFGGLGCYGGEGMTVNIVNNYYKPGPGTPSKIQTRIAAPGVRTQEYVNTYPAYAPALHLWGKYYVEGNKISNNNRVTQNNWTYGVLAHIDQSASATDGTWNSQVAEEIHALDPMPFVATTTHSADDAYDRVLAYVGASLSRDTFDAQMVKDATNGTASGNATGFIDSQDDNKPAGAPSNWSAWPELAGTEAPVDTDGDGMPDEWEIANGLDPENAADGNLRNAEGYTNLDLYLASLVEHITEAQNAGGEIEGEYLYGEEPLEYYELSNATREGTAWTFGHNIGISNSGNGSYSTSGEYIGLARDHRHTITLPDFIEVKWIEVEGRGRYTTSSYTEANLVELNGEEYAEGTYALPKTSDNAEVSTFTVPLTPPAMWNLTMTWKGNNPLCRIKLHTTDCDGIENVVVSEEDFLLNGGDDSWYNLQGMRVANPSSPGIYIHRGKKVLVK